MVIDVAGSANHTGLVYFSFAWIFAYFKISVMSLILWWIFKRGAETYPVSILASHSALCLDLVTDWNLRLGLP
jgi:hypothetical protein